MHGVSRNKVVHGGVIKAAPARPSVHKCAGQGKARAITTEQGYRWSTLPVKGRCGRPNPTQ
eukprot:4025244-Heterocapsa_arctica.AAC.1